MWKAQFVAFVLLADVAQVAHSSAAGECLSSESCPSEDSQVGAQALLQTGRSHTRATVDGDEATQPLRQRELLEHTMPLQKQIDLLNVQVAELRTQQERPQSSSKSASKAAASEAEEQELETEEAAAPAEASYQRRSSREAAAVQEADAEQRQQATRGGNSRSNRRSTEAGSAQQLPPPKTERKGRVPPTEAGGDPGTDEETWGGVAPKPHWNDLEKAQDVSQSRTGYGVATGNAYRGDHPYETLMDVDYLIDSNPAEARAPAKKAPRETAKLAPKEAAKLGPKAPSKLPPAEAGKVAGKTVTTKTAKTATEATITAETLSTHQKVLVNTATTDEERVAELETIEAYGAIPTKVLTSTKLLDTVKKLAANSPSKAVVAAAKRCLAGWGV